jgi:preprotein translocase subunit SecA
MTKQREVLYSQRRDVLETEDLHEIVREMYMDVFESLFDTHIPTDAYADDWDLEGLAEALLRDFGLQVPLTPEHVAELNRDTLFEQLHQQLKASYEEKIQEMGSESFQALERWVILHFIDRHWKDHLLSMDHLKEGIGLRGYGQKNPLNEYKREGFDMFVDMTERVKTDVVSVLFKAERMPDDEPLPVRQTSRPSRTIAHRGGLADLPQESGGETAVATVRRQGEKVGRNAPCPCGSGRKFKRCCGA